MDRKKENAASEVFKAAGDIRRNVQLDWFPSETRYVMSVGFKEAADFVVEAAIVAPLHPDRYYRPILFLYRHYLELQLKTLIFCGNQLLQTAPANHEVHGYDLADLWEQAREVLIRVWPKDDERQLDPVAQVIEAFHHVDVTGQGSRYNKDTHGDVCLTNSPRTISIEHLRNVMADVYKLLWGCECGIREYLANKAEMLAYLASDCGP